MNRLRRLDKVAYVRFASVYLDFKDVGEFMTELKELLDLKESCGEASGGLATISSCHPERANAVEGRHFQDSRRG